MTIYDKSKLIARTFVEQLNILFNMGKQLEGSKQDKLIAGNNVVMNGNTISVMNGTEPGITVDTELSSESINPVQNKVIYEALDETTTNLRGEITESADDLTAVINSNYTDLVGQINTKQDASVLIRRIWIGNDETPSVTLGDNGDIYIYKP